MPSPFPGMNPYLEQDLAWNDFHESFMPAARDAIAAQVRPHFIAKINEHLFIHLPTVDIERMSFIEIRDRDGWELVTVIELLSPSNKYAGPDRDQYLAKRLHLLASSVHLVEIDLLRGGPRMPMRDLAACDYCVLVSRADTRPEAGVWPIDLRDRLPSVPIPLRPPHADARLDLQQVLDRVYDAAGYEDYIYRGQPHPLLNAANATWAQQFIPGVQ